MGKAVATTVSNFFGQYPTRAFPKGQVLIHADDKPDHIYFLISGEVKQYDISNRGDEVIVNVFKPGAFFPLQPVVTELPNKFFFEAESDAEVHLAPIPETLTFINAHPDVMYDLLRRVYMGMDGVLGRLVHLMASDANNRLLYELLLEARRFGEQAKDGSCTFKLSETALAAKTGLSRETISREMKKLSRAGVANIDHGTIHINDFKQLEHTLNQER